MTVYLLIGPSPYILCDSLFLKDKYFLSCVRVSHNSCQNNLVAFAFLSLWLFLFPGTLFQFCLTLYLPRSPHLPTLLPRLWALRCINCGGLCTHEGSSLLICGVHDVCNLGVTWSTSLPRGERKTLATAHWADGKNKAWQGWATSLGWWGSEARAQWDCKQPHT